MPVSIKLLPVYTAQLIAFGIFRKSALKQYEDVGRLVLLLLVIVVCRSCSCCCCVGMKLLESQFGSSCFYGKREKVKDLLQLSHVKALVTSHEPKDWQMALSTISQVSCILIYCF